MSYLKLILAMMASRFLWEKRKLIISCLVTISVASSTALKNPDKFLRKSIKNAQYINQQVIKLAHWGCRNVYGKRFLGVKVFTPYICKKGKKK